MACFRKSTFRNYSGTQHGKEDVHYFFIRKFWFLYYAKALVGFPGGFGTMDEVFELLTLLQTKKIEKQVPVVLFDSMFWNEVVNFEALQEYGTSRPTVWLRSYRHSTFVVWPSAAILPPTACITNLPPLLVS